MNINSSETKEVQLNDLKGNIKWIGDNLCTGADTLFIELQDEQGLTAYVSPFELLTYKAYNRLSDYCRSRIESGLKAQSNLH